MATENPESRATLLFLFPLVAPLFAEIWVYNYKRTMEISGYIRTQIETHFDHKGWETLLHLAATTPQEKNPLASAVVSARLFIAVQVLSSLIASALLFFNDRLQWPNLFWSIPLILGIVWTIVVFRQAYDYEKREPPNSVLENAGNEPNMANSADAKSRAAD